MPFSKFAIVDHNMVRKAQFALAMRNTDTFCDPYSDLHEFVVDSGRNGCIFFADDGKQSAIDALKQLALMGRTNTLIAFSSQPDVRRACDTIKAGAIDYITFPFSISAVVERLKSEESALVSFSQNRRRAIIAKSKLATLSEREGQVIDFMSDGCSNKEIAMRLGISSRTVEIHRGNALGRLNVNHSAKAIRIKVESELF